LIRKSLKASGDRGFFIGANKMKSINDRASVIGRIYTTKARAENPRLPGWEFDNGLWVRRSKSRNMVVLAGLSMMAKSIQYGNALAGKTIRYLEVGTGFTYPVKGDTALQSAVVRKAIDSWDNTDIASDPVVMIASVLFTTAEAVGALMECGLFQESTGAPMFSRGLFGYGAISNITKADPAVVTSYAHGLVDGDKIYIEGVDGMTEVNGNAYFIDKLTNDTFGLYSDAALTTSVNSSAYGAYSEASPGNDTWKLIIPKTSAETMTVTYSLTFPVE
jgi:hypothetical protein